MVNQVTYFPSLHFPYPLRQKVGQVAHLTQAPPDLVAVTGLMIASFAVQYLIDVEREGGGTSSVGLSAVILAESGARKTTVASHFLGPVREFEKKALVRSTQAQIDFESDLSVWDAKRKGVLAEIRERTRAGEGSAEFESILLDLDRKKPEPPIQVQAIYQDFSPEGLLQGIAGRWPSAAIISDEASELLRGRSFSDLALLNKLWDGEHSIRNRVDEYVPLRWPTRLTTLLMVQPGEFSRFMSKRGDSARDIGTLARMLICSPPSTQGVRFVNPQGTVSLEALEYEARVHQLLDLTFERISAGKTHRDVMRMSYSARLRWVDFYNEIEERLGPGRDLQSLGAFGSKIAENALRIAAVLQYFDNGALEISEALMQAGVEIARYFLFQHRCLFLAPSAHINISDAQILFDRLCLWSARTGKQGWSRSQILRNLPYALRSGGRGVAALQALIGMGWLFEAFEVPPAQSRRPLIWLYRQVVAQSMAAQSWQQMVPGLPQGGLATVVM